MTIKRLLALCLVAALSLCLLPTAEAEVLFGDKSDIVNTESAEMLTSLGIIQGFPDGKFRPNEDVTRAQLAKMIYYILNGIRDTGEDRAYLYIGSEFPDVAGHWASGYIYYCHRKGIIAGYTDGSYRPDKNVTATEACKMLLVALGYEPTRYVGTVWSANTVSDAKAAGITANYSYAMTSTLDRDNAALFIYNSMFSDMKSGGSSKGTTLLQIGYGAQRRKVTVVSNEIATLTGPLSPVGYTRVQAKDGAGESILLEESSGVDRLGHTYVVYIGSSIEAGVWTLYGNFFASDDDITLIDTSPELGYYDIVGRDKAFTDVSGSAEFYLNYNQIDSMMFRSLVSAHPDRKVIYISDNGDTLLDRAIILDTWICQIESLTGGQQVTLYNRSGSISWTNVVYEGILRKNAFYSVTQIGTKYLFEDASEFTASCSAYRVGRFLTIGSKEYGISTAQAHVSLQAESFVSASQLASSAYLGVTMTFLVDANGLIAGAYLYTDAGRANYALLISSASGVRSSSSNASSAAEQTVSLLLGGTSDVGDYSVFFESAELYSTGEADKEAGLYSYTAINSDGTIYGLKKAGTPCELGTQIVITKGVSAIAGLPSYSADENTEFFFWSGSENDTPVSYRGIYNVPPVSLTVSSTARVWYASSGSALEAVYFTISDPGASGGSGYVYIFDATPTVSTEATSQGSLSNVYTYEGYSGGSRVRLKTRQPSIRKGLFAYTTSNNFSTLYEMGSSNCVRATISDIYSGFIYLSGDISPSSIHKWAAADIYLVNIPAATMTAATSLMTNTDVIIVYNRTGENTADAAYIFIGDGIEFGALIA